ncbi:hypothetical protein [Streptomyces sindenensis]|uniref:Uncharacterized protein n=1 Tax=Streptomyces sindenensis TaxID=67363 RepID=A0ABW6EYT5_9ACTN
MQTLPGTAWNTLDTVARLADSITWESGSDSLSAMQCAQACIAARDLLPPPTAGEPSPTPTLAPGPDALAPYVELLHTTARSLAGLGAADAAAQTEVAAEALTAVREQ